MSQATRDVGHHKHKRLICSRIDYQYKLNRKNHLFTIKMNSKYHVQDIHFTRVWHIKLTLRFLSFAIFFNFLEHFVYMQYWSLQTSYWLFLSFVCTAVPFSRLCTSLFIRRFVTLTLVVKCCYLAFLDILTTSTFQCPVIDFLILSTVTKPITLSASIFCFLSLNLE